MNKVTTFQFPNLGYLIADVPDNVSAVLNQRIKTAIENQTKELSHAKNLVGHIKKEINIFDIKEEIEPFLLCLVAEYEKQFSYLKSINILQKDGYCVLDTLWANLQEKYEYNPVHNHSGVFSFVAWLAIPYTLEAEDKVFNELVKHKRKNGRFEFYFSDALGRIQNYCLEYGKELENKICLFPSALAHSVYPFFTSNKYRISISGNIKLNF